MFLANVTFEPGCRNNWHIHRAKSGGGQLLICTAGEGWYQEEGKPAVSLTPGTVITIPANVKHWHGAKQRQLVQPHRRGGARARRRPTSGWSRWTTRPTTAWSKGAGSMEYTKLGNSDLTVSRICMGCMGFGDAQNGQHSWTLDEEHSREIIKRGLELGVNFFDTAIGYQSGTSEQYLGRALRDFARREDVVVATKFLPRTQEEIAAGVSGQAAY